MPILELVKQIRCFRIYYPLTLNGYSNFINAVKRQRNLGLRFGVVIFLKNQIGIYYLTTPGYHVSSLVINFICIFANISQVPIKKSTNLAILSELGRIPLLLDCFINVIKYWKRLESNPSPY